MGLGLGFSFQVDGLGLWVEGSELYCFVVWVLPAMKNESACPTQGRFMDWDLRGLRFRSKVSMLRILLYTVLVGTVRDRMLNNSETSTLISLVLSREWGNGSL